MPNVELELLKAEANPEGYAIKKGIGIGLALIELEFAAEMALIASKLWVQRSQGLRHLTVRAVGLNSVVRDLGAIDKALERDLRKALKEAAEPIRDGAARSFSAYSTKSAAGFKVSVRGRGESVSVYQSRRKTTGRRPDFGSLQMKRGLLPALAANENEIFGRVEGAITKTLVTHGFA